MEAIVADLNRILLGWFACFTHVKTSKLSSIDGWIHRRLRAILRKRMDPVAAAAEKTACAGPIATSGIPGSSSSA